jgi:hypothetical protein
MTFGSYFGRRMKMDGNALLLENTIKLFNK